MTFVVTRACIGCKDTSCVEVCPCDCFHEGPEMLFINPDCCTECEACASVCPSNAIFLDADVPDAWRDDIQLNQIQSQIHPVISERRRS